MTTTLLPPDAPVSASRLADVEVVLPVYNEAAALETCVRRLRHFLDTSFPFPATVTIADNASTDGTWAIASQLAATLSGVRAVRLEQKGRGRALRIVWSASTPQLEARSTRWPEATVLRRRTFFSVVRRRDESQIVRPTTRSAVSIAGP